MTEQTAIEFVDFCVEQFERVENDCTFLEANRCLILKEWR